MSNYPGLGLPEAWKPLFRAIADHGLELEMAQDVSDVLGCRHILGFGSLFLSFWDEPEWCGNHLQQAGLTLATLTVEPPTDLYAAEEHALLLTGDWEHEVGEFVSSFLKAKGAKMRAIEL